MGSLGRFDDEKLLLLREKYCAKRAFCIVRSSVGCEDQPCISVHREGRKGEREKER